MNLRRMKSRYQYQDADKSFTIGEDDPDMDIVTISLPSPPELKYIHGYGKDPKDQKFEYEEYPARLKRLEDVVRANLIKHYEKRRDQTFTEQKFIMAMWEKLEEVADQYEKEIEWIRSQIYFAMHGKWYFINGKPTYLTEDHWYLLNYWTSADCERFDYRDRDRRVYLFSKYLWETDEDETGQSIGSRTFYGPMYPKHRRDGATHKYLAAFYRDTIFRKGSHMGIQSFDENNSETHYKNKLVVAWQKMPFFFKPLWHGSNSPSAGMKFSDNSLSDAPVVNSRITYATTAGRKFYEGDFLTSLQVEEAGKTVLENVSERWDVQQQCVARADGAVIIGKVAFPSTVYELEGEGGKEFKVLTDRSKFYERIPGKKQTGSGLAVLFIPAYDGLEGFIGPYGESIIDDPAPEQAAFIRKNYGAKQHIEAENEILLRKGDVESLEKFRERKRLFPCCLADCFISNEGGTDFNMQILTNRKAELSRLRAPLVVRGNYFLIPSGSGVPMSSSDILRSGMDISKMIGRVVFEVDGVNGRWEIKDTEGGSMKYIRDGHWFPSDPKYTLGADPFKFTVNPVKASKRLGRSKGGGALIRNRDLGVDPIDKDIKDWETYNIRGYYSYRANSDDEYVLDMLLAAIYHQAMIFPETNNDVVLKNLIKWKHAGYLQFAVDPVTGKVRDLPGMSTQTKSKEDVMQALNRYIEFRGAKEVFLSFINDCISINSPDQLKHYDGLVAVGYGLIGAESANTMAPKGPSEEGFDMGRAFKKKKYRTKR